MGDHVVASAVRSVHAHVATRRAAILKSLHARTGRKWVWCQRCGKAVKKRSSHVARCSSEPEACEWCSLAFPPAEHRCPAEPGVACRFGCAFRGARVLVERHEEGCGPQCPRCGERDPSRFHDEGCAGLRRWCKWRCGTELPVTELGEHEAACGATEMPCPAGCGRAHTRVRVFEHEHCDACPRPAVKVAVRKLVEAERRARTSVRTCAWGCGRVLEPGDDAYDHETLCADTFVACPGGCGSRHRRCQVVVRGTNRVQRCNKCSDAYLAWLQQRRITARHE